ncbi:MAG: hypothetical protein ACRDHW_00365, partial [Ktedonobacteraceae bacterium]
MAKQRSIAYVPWRLLAGIILGSLILVIYFLIKPGPPPQFVLVVNLMGILYPLGLWILCVKGTRRFLRAPTVTGTRRATRRFT